LVEIRAELDVTVINGLAVMAAVQPQRLWAVLGEPSRIVDPAAPAPFGHRNNQIHVYDNLGLVAVHTPIDGCQRMPPSN
jgi:hypothetical protein